MITSGSANDSQIAFFALLLLTSVGTILADGYTTIVGLQHGFVEGNPVMRWLFSKIGQSFSIFVSATVVIFGGVLISNYNLAASEVYLGAITVAEGVRAYLNYRKLAAQKISLE